MKRHESMRGYFAYELYQHMKRKKNVWLVVGDVGYKVFDAHFRDFPDRCINTGAAEQSMMGIAVGLALSGKRVVVYTITPFLLYRPFETIRNYVDHENIPLILAGSGRDNDYHIDGFSHSASDAKSIISNFENIESYWPNSKGTIPMLLNYMLSEKTPFFLSLTR